MTVGQSYRLKIELDLPESAINFEVRCTQTMTRRSYFFQCVQSIIFSQVGMFQVHRGGDCFLYRVGMVVGYWVGLTLIWGVPPAGGPLL